MDPFITTIINKGAVLAVDTGLLAFGIFLFLGMASLQRAMLNNNYTVALP